MNGLSAKTKTNIGVAILLVSFLVFGFIITPAGIMISAAGGEMAELSSVSGTSVAEHYYRLQGEIYKSAGRIIAFLGGITGIAGTVYSILLIKANTGVSVRIVREQQPYTAPAAYHAQAEAAQNYAEGRSAKSCSRCGAPLTEESRFCTRCGTPAEKREAGVRTERRVCRSCGKPLAEGAEFCTKCGQRWSGTDV